MSYSQHEADLQTENRELRERLQGALVDLEDERSRNTRAQEHITRQDLRLQEKQARIDQLMAEKKRFADWVTGD